MFYVPLEVEQFCITILKRLIQEFKETVKKVEFYFS